MSAHLKRVFHGVLGVVLLGGSPVGGQAVDESKLAVEVLAILEAKCFSCHGPDRVRGGLRLDDPDRLREEGRSGKRAVVPGDPSESELLRRVSLDDVDERMPLELPPLLDHEIETLRRWIASGAPRAADQREHWSYLPLQRADPPEVGLEAWIENPIDRFVLARLEAADATPAPKADRATLIRRLSLDLLGLPPTPEEVERFTQDAREGAYERLVQRLLDSPHYGEKWARHWLDLARYADSNGYSYDSPRSMWPYRDWVIRSFNRDMPFDEFTIEQLAGDLLDRPSRDQLIATGFHRNTMIQEEMGADDEEYRIEAVKDRVETTGTTWLGMTLNCAQCHDHKYDPITQRDYYGLFAIFNNSLDRGRSNRPKIKVPTVEQMRETKALEPLYEKVLERLAPDNPEVRKARQEWERNFTPTEDIWSPVELLTFQSTANVSLEQLPDNSILASGPPVFGTEYLVTAKTSLPRITALRIEMLPDESLPGGGPGRGVNGDFVLSEVEFALVQAGGEAAGEAKKFSSVTASSSLRDWAPEDAIDGFRFSGWAVGQEAGRAHEIVLMFAQPIDIQAASVLRVSLGQQAGFRYLIGRFRLSVSDTSATSRARPYSIEHIAGILATPAGERNQRELDELSEYHVRTDARFEPIHREIDSLLERRPRAATTLVMRERPARRATHLFVRGDFTKPGPLVEPSTPGILPPLDKLEPTRLDLARWLVDDASFVTARVTVNRWWQRFFGVGLVETEDDFGTRGSPPSHPALLDWLAGQFIARGWSMKEMHRLIVSSSTYRQSSNPGTDLSERDPTNRLLSHQSRLRLEPEVIRDSALRAAGLLNPAVGGPPVYPPLPAYESPATVPKQWPTSEGSDRYRRTLYTHLWRTDPFPYLLSFDFSAPTSVCSRRMVSNTALQALVLANDPMFVELAVGMGERVMAIGTKASVKERIDRLFFWSLGRIPRADELEIVVQFYEQQRGSFAAAREEALEFTAGPSSVSTKSIAPTGATAPDKLVEKAAWTAVARLIINLDEFITRE